MLLDKSSYTIFDVETTGLWPHAGDKICEIAAVRFSAGSRRLEKFHSLVDPQRPISYGAFSVNGITEDMVRGKPLIREVLPDFLEFAKGSALVAYNANFDVRFLEYALGEDKGVLDAYHVIDSLGLARRLFPGLGRYNLASVADSLGINADGAHRAMADVLMTQKIFKKQLRILIRRGAKTIYDIK